MRTKSEYLLPNGDIDRGRFREDIIRYAREHGMSVPQVLGNFFSNGEFTKKEMGRFALNTSHNGHLIVGTVTLLHALGLVTKDTVSSFRILEDYIQASVTDPAIYSGSWIIDSMMNWPQGTLLPSSCVQLAKI